MEEQIEVKDEVQLNQKNKSIVCSRCNKTKKKYAKGFCKCCYNYVHMNKETHKLHVYKWMRKNPNYFKDYYKRTKLKQIIPSVTNE